jgi:hypothetical protein
MTTDPFKQPIYDPSKREPQRPDPFESPFESPPNPEPSDPSVNPEEDDDGELVEIPIPSTTD